MGYGRLGEAIALIKLVGLGVISLIVKRRTDGVTNRRLEEHLTSVEFDERIDAIVVKAVHVRLQYTTKSLRVLSK